MMAAGGLVALPVAVSWPIHRALIWLHDEVEQRGQVLPFAVRVRSDPDAYIAVEGAEEALAALIAEGFPRAVRLWVHRPVGSRGGRRYGSPACAAARGPRDRGASGSCWPASGHVGIDGAEKR